jgi:glycerophosphoryl diester phosphodiesterase
MTSPPAPTALRPLLDPDAHPVIGHRGAAGDAPENTLPSFALAVEQGADALELDVHTSADGVPVVIHDPTLDRTTDRAGAVAALSLARIREADAGARFSPDGGRTFPFRGRGVRVPTLAEVLEAFPDRALVIEIKTARAQDAVRRLLLEHGAAGRCIVASADGAAVQAFRAPPWLTGASGLEPARLRFALPWRRATAVPYAALFVPERHRGIPVVTPGFVAAARALAVPVHVWTVNDEARARRLWKRGVSGLISNFPGRMLALRAELFGGR